MKTDTVFGKMTRVKRNGREVWGIVVTAYTLLFRGKHLFSLIAAKKSLSLIIGKNLSMRDHRWHFLPAIRAILTRLSN